MDDQKETEFLRFLEGSTEMFDGGSEPPAKPEPFVEDIRAECRSLLRLYNEVLRREMQSRYDDCIVCEDSWYKSQPDAYLTSHWDALRAVRDRIDEIVRADWRDRRHRTGVRAILLKYGDRSLGG